MCEDELFGSDLFLLKTKLNIWWILIVYFKILHRIKFKNNCPLLIVIFNRSHINNALNPFFLHYFPSSDWCWLEFANCWSGFQTWWSLFYLGAPACGARYQVFQVRSSWRFDLVLVVCRTNALASNYVVFSLLFHAGATQNQWGSVVTMVAGW